MVRARFWLAVGLVSSAMPVIGLTAGSAAAATADCHGTATGAGVLLDFNGDGCADAVVGMPERTVAGHRHAGAIEIDFGSARHRLRARSILVTAEHPHAGDHFGASIAPTDASSGSLSSIVIGVPGRDVGGVTNSGAVVVLPGAASWPDVVRVPNGSFDVIANRPRAAARLGTAVAVADTPSRNSDGSFSLPATVYAGAPGWNVDRQRAAGAVLMVRLDTLAHSGPRSPDIISQDARGVPGRSRAGDHFGSAVAPDINFGGGVDDSTIAIGAPGKAVDGRPGAGAVVVTVTPSSHLAARVLNQDSPGDGNAPEAGDHFGAVLTTNGADLYIGVPDEDVGSNTDAGIVERYATEQYRSSLRQGTHHFPGRPEAGDHFGTALSFLASSRTTGLCPPGLIVGVPGQDVAGLPDAGEVDCGGQAPLRMGARLPGALHAHARVGSALQTIQSGRWDFRDPQTCDCPGTEAYLLTLVGAPGIRSGRGGVIEGTVHSADIWHRTSDPLDTHYGATL